MYSRFYQTQKDAVFTPVPALPSPLHVIVDTDCTDGALTTKCAEPWIPREKKKLPVRVEIEYLWQSTRILKVPVLHLSYEVTQESGKCFQER